MRSDRAESALDVSRMRRAAAVTDGVFDAFLRALRPGVTELELADLVRSEILSLGGEGEAFDTIVAFGASGAEPHHVPADVPLERGMLVTVDMGAKFEGMCSDFTRTVAFGEPSPEAREIYAIVLEASRRALAAVRVGAACRDVDAAARNYIAERGYGERYIHGTGHGVGALIHQAPTLNAKSEEILAEGEVVTVEPGIYIPSVLGVRIEDMVEVGDGRPWSRHTTELIVI